MFNKLLAATAIAVVGCFGSFASAQSPPENYPDRTLRIVVPFAPGGGVDVLTRIIAQRLSVLSESRWLSKTKSGQPG